MLVRSMGLQMQKVVVDVLIDMSCHKSKAVQVVILGQLMRLHHVVSPPKARSGE